MLEPVEPERDGDAVDELARDDLAGVPGRPGLERERRAVTFYSATPGMVERPGRAGRPTAVPGQVPGARVTTSDPTAVQTVAERSEQDAGDLYPDTTIGMRDDRERAPSLVGASARRGPRRRSSPDVAAYRFDLPEGFQADPARSAS